MQNIYVKIVCIYVYLYVMQYAFSVTYCALRSSTILSTPLLLTVFSALPISKLLLVGKKSRPLCNKLVLGMYILQNTDDSQFFLLPFISFHVRFELLGESLILSECGLLIVCYVNAQYIITILTYGIYSMHQVLSVCEIIEWICGKCCTCKSTILRVHMLLSVLFTR